MITMNIQIKKVYWNYIPINIKYANFQMTMDLFHLFFLIQFNELMILSWIVILDIVAFQSSDIKAMISLLIQYTCHYF